MIREREGAAPYLRVASESAHPQHHRQPFLNAVVVVGCSTAGGRTIRRPTRTSRSLSAGCPPRSIRRPTRSWWRVPTRRKPPLPFSPGPGYSRCRRRLPPGRARLQAGDRVMAILAYAISPNSRSPRRRKPTSTFRTGELVQRPAQSERCSNRDPAFRESAQLAPRKATMEDRAMNLLSCWFRRVSKGPSWMLHEAGMSDVSVLRGGMEQWRVLGLAAI
jgi:hypothetical protein